jgi:hypothetical protein
MDFLVSREDLSECRTADEAVAELEPGQSLLEVDAFGLTSNNITYAVFGDAMSYWKFFPAEEGWGRVPVWGFADVSATANDELEEGTRVFGYLPPSTHLIVTPGRVDGRGFVDASPHRSKLPPAYNGYVRVDADPAYDPSHEDHQMLLRPLFFTSFLLDDFLADNRFFGAEAVVLSSASSKTALGTAFLLAGRDGIEVIGLTSAQRVDFVEGLDTYDRVLPYEEVATLPAAATVYVDMAGDAELRSAVHRHFGEALTHSAVVGATHWGRRGDVPEGLPGPRPTFFFAPDQVSKRTAEWGREGLDTRLADAWHPFVDWSADWLEVEHGRGPEAVEHAYLELLEGRADPSIGHVLSMRE